jgi:hypothetical protein
VLAAREIGRETVQYVSNIFRYYLAYALITQHERERADALHSPSTTAFPRRAAAPGR